MTALLVFAAQDIKALGGEATAINLDVSEGRDAIAEGIKSAVAVYGHIYILVSFASVKCLEAFKSRQAQPSHLPIVCLAHKENENPDLQAFLVRYFAVAFSHVYRKAHLRSDFVGTTLIIVFNWARCFWLSDL